MALKVENSWLNSAARKRLEELLAQFVGKKYDAVCHEISKISATNPDWRETFGIFATVGKGNIIEKIEVRAFS